MQKPVDLHLCYCTSSYMYVKVSVTVVSKTG